MTDQPRSRLPQVGREQRRAAAGQFERANQVLGEGNLDYALQLFLNCCLLDPINPIYRQALRQAEKSRRPAPPGGFSFAYLKTLPSRGKMLAALKRGDAVKVLDFAERILLTNPWDLGAHLAMAEAFENLDLPELALWTLDQYRQGDPKNLRVNRWLATLLEARGNYAQALTLWDQVRQAHPQDGEAHQKFKDLAAHATIAKGKYKESLQGQGQGHIVPEAADDETAANHVPLEGTAPELPAVTDRVLREVGNLQSRIDANPTNPHGYLHLAGMHRRADRLAEARKVLLDGLAATGNHFDVAQELADLEIEAYRRDLAVAEAKHAAAQDDAPLAELCRNLRREIAARELDWYRRRAERYPTDTTARFEMGVRLLQTGQIDEAIKELQHLRTDPRHQGKALVYLGYCFHHKKNWRLAQRNFEEALKHLGRADQELRKDILFQLAQGYAQAGDFQRAVDLACELADIDFSYRDIGRLLDDWSAKLQKA